jgi:hypothetical protein
MRISYWVMLACLGLAVLFTVLAESNASGRLGKRLEAAVSVMVVLSCYGVCVGLISAVLGHFLQIREWIALLVSVPLAIPVLLAAAWMGEQ